MIKDFETLKKQLTELANIINNFKSEAVQVRLVDLYLELARANEAASALNTLHKLVPNEPELAPFDMRLKNLTNKTIAKP